MGRTRTGMAFDLGSEAVGSTNSADGGTTVELAHPTTETGPRARPNYLVDCIKDAEHLEAFKRPMRALAERALEPGPGARFAWSKAALKHLSHDADLGGVALVWRHAQRG